MSILLNVLHSVVYPLAVWLEQYQLRCNTVDFMGKTNDCFLICAVDLDRYNLSKCMSCGDNKNEFLVVESWVSIDSNYPFMKMMKPSTGELQERTMRQMTETRVPWPSHVLLPLHLCHFPFSLHGQWPLTTSVLNGLPQLSPWCGSSLTLKKPQVRKCTKSTIWIDLSSRICIQCRWLGPCMQRPWRFSLLLVPIQGETWIIEII